MIELSDLIGSGTVKDVYQHPLSEKSLIKVIKPSLIAPDGGFVGHSKFKRRMHQGVYRQFRRELIQFLQLCKNQTDRSHFIFPMETPYGLIATNRGLGLIVEKIVDPQGEGVTLEMLASNQQFEFKHHQALQQFFEDCIRLHLVFGEVNIAGIMYTENRNNRPEFVLVDGIGEKLFIPIRTMSFAINARYIRKVSKRIFAQVAALQARHAESSLAK